jgi:hypothetical protein
MKRTFTAFAMIVGPKFLTLNFRPSDRKVSEMNKGLLVMLRMLLPNKS